MKLSEAIRLGAMLKPQGFNAFVSLDGSTCALGAAAAAIGIVVAGFDLEPLCQQWPWLVRGERHCSLCCTTTTDTADLITHLNDKHRWTREQIADWVATVEPVNAGISHESHAAVAKGSPYCESPTRVPVSSSSSLVGGGKGRAS